MKNPESIAQRSGSELHLRQLTGCSSRYISHASQSTVHDMSPVETISGSSQVIAPSIRRFQVARRHAYNGGDKSPAKVKVTKDSAVNPALSKQLAESIKTVSKKVNAINSSFEEVKQAISSPLLSQDICDNKELVMEWGGLEKDFNATLQNSSKVANGAGALIRDFLLVVMPYLMDDTDIKIKQKELGEYRAELDQGGDLAFNFVSDFKDISRRVQEFKRSWKSHTAEILDRLSKEIDELEESLARANGHINEKIRLKVLKKTSKEQGDSEPKVVKHIDSIDKGTVDLVAVWNLIYDDLNTIVSQLSLVEKGSSRDLFRKRLEALDVQYRDLWNSLQNYSSATDPSSSKPSFFAKLFRLKM